MVATLLERPTLVLNRNWQPVYVSTVSRSLVKVYTGVARFVDPHDFQLYTWEDWSKLQPREGDLVLRSARLRIRVPEVVSLTRYDRVPTGTVAFSRRNIFKRDHFRCQYCGVRPSTEELTVDHVIPRSQGGVSSWENCVLACLECNKRKADRTPIQAGMRLLKHPIRPRWRPLYAARGAPIDSWSRFISEAYWNVELDD